MMREVSENPADALTKAVACPEAGRSARMAALSSSSTSRIRALLSHLVAVRISFTIRKACSELLCRTLLVTSRVSLYFDGSPLCV